MARKFSTSSKDIARLEEAAAEASRRLAGVQELLQLHERYAEVLAKTRVHTSQHADLEGTLSNVSSP
jgi:hypothetical protein